MKKAQMEILGLAIVVLLILMATIFVVRFLVLKTPTDYRRGFVGSELASNMLNAFLKTNAEECLQLTMTELIRDCAQGTLLECSNRQNSCEFVDSAAKKIFAQTLKSWNVQYEFLVYIKDSNAPMLKTGNPCKADKESEVFFVPTNIGTVNVKLDICR